MSKKTLILVGLLAFVLGYYLSNKIKSSFVGSYLIPV